MKQTDTTTKKNHCIDLRNMLSSLSSRSKTETKSTKLEMGDAKLEMGDDAQNVRRHIARIDALLDLTEVKIREVPMDGSHCLLLKNLFYVADSLLRNREKFIVNVNVKEHLHQKTVDEEKIQGTEWGVPANRRDIDE